MILRNHPALPTLNRAGVPDLVHGTGALRAPANDGKAFQAIRQSTKKTINLFHGVWYIITLFTVCIPSFSQTIVGYKTCPAGTDPITITSNGGTPIHGCAPSSKQGPQGPPGKNGTNGINGRDGLNGAPGKDGAPGPRGDKGDIGSSGSQGVSGLQGPAGAVGPSGAAGAAGSIGSVGPPGPSGAMGASGPAGVQGPSGTAFNVGWGLITDENGKPSLNSAVAMSWPDAEAGADKWCASSNGTFRYTCKLKVAATSIPRLILLSADVACPSVCSLNVDSTGLGGIKQNNGTTADASFGIGIHLLTWDGSVWRLLL